ncbi:MAG TPA: hypothetical protein VI916_01410 [Acidimicrobiia bacterium]|nr:hypothetical protein [Acidimicrobiia bacterium]
MGRSRVRRRQREAESPAVSAPLRDSSAEGHARIGAWARVVAARDVAGAINHGTPGQRRRAWVLWIVLAAPFAFAIIVALIELAEAVI